MAIGVMASPARPVTATASTEPDRPAAEVEVEADMLVELPGIPVPSRMGTVSGDRPVARAPSAPVAAPSAPVVAPVSVTAPAVGIDAALTPVGLNDDGSMAVPPTTDIVGWYDLGPVPGARGPAVLAGHVDSRTGPGAFFRLRDLRPGDEIHVALQNESAVRFVVERVESHPKDQLPVNQIWDDTTEPVLRLITCGGGFDRSRRSYRENIVVFARLAPPPGTT